MTPHPSLQVWVEHAADLGDEEDADLEGQQGIKKQGPHKCQMQGSMLASLIERLEHPSW